MANAKEKREKFSVTTWSWQFQSEDPQDVRGERCCSLLTFRDLNIKMVGTEQTSGGQLCCLWPSSNSIFDVMFSFFMSCVFLSLWFSSFRISVMFSDFNRTLCFKDSGFVPCWFVGIWFHVFWFFFPPQSSLVVFILMITWLVICLLCFSVGLTSFVTVLITFSCALLPWCFHFPRVFSCLL